MQTINLYDPGLRKQESKLNARAALVAAAGVFACLLIVSGINIFRLYAFESELTSTQKQLNIAKKQVNELTEKLPKLVRDDSLPAKLEKMQREYEQKQSVLAVLSERSLGNREGFVEHFTGFARQHVSGLWLTQLKLERGGTQLSLAGHALKPEYIPKYLQKLANEPVLQGTEFKTFLLVNESKQNRKVDFSITTSKQISQ